MRYNDMIVKLTSNDLKLARDVGTKRHRSHDGHPDGKVLSDGLAIHIKGAEAELATAKGFNLPWDGKFFDLEKWEDWRENGHDVCGLEVRSTPHKNGCLLIHDSDKDNSPYVLVLTHERPKFILAGWCFGREGKCQELWRDVGYGRPCYFIPQDMLRSIAELKEHIKER